jgi:tripartite-type tricarboxylate transporter receptor subunit TctC
MRENCAAGGSLMHLAVRAVAAASLCAATLFASPASAQSAAPQNWPQRPVKFILPLGPGSGADIGARLIAEKLTAKWGQPVVVENRPGGDGFVAITAFLGARDDHTLFYGPAASFTAHPYLHEKLPYDPRDLAPVARVSATLISLTAPPQLNVKSLGELFAMARATPGKLNWASVTGATDVVISAFLKREGLDMAKIPYRDPVQALNDVAEGRLHFYWSSLAIVRAAVQSGRLKLLAITSTAPSKVVPGVPTAIEAGFPGLTFDGLVGFYGTRDMPLERRERVASDVRQALADPLIVQRLEAGGQEVVPGSAAEFAADIDKQSRGAAENAKVLGIKAATQ